MATTAATNPADSAVTLSGEVINSDPVVGQPHSPLVAAGGIWMLDASKNPGIHLISTSGNLLRSYGRFGQGPGDFEAPFSLSATNDDSLAAWVWDPRLRRLTRLSHPDAADSAIRLVSLESPGVRISRAIRLDSGRYVGFAPNEQEHQLQLFDGSGVRVGVMPSYVPGDSTVPIEERLRSIANVRLCGRADGQGFAIAYPDFGRIDMYDRDGRLQAYAGGETSGADLFPVDPATDVRQFRSPQRGWFMSCAVTARHVFALRFATLMRDESDSGDIIQIFTWDGTLVRTLGLDRRVYGIAVDQAEELLYTVSLESSDLARFRIPRTR
jgi:hypothetical protein